MSSGVRISGMNSNLDTEAIVEALVSAKKEKLNTFKGEQKKHLTVEMLLEQFARASGDEFVNDRALLG